MNNQRILECTSLAEDILRNFELSELPIQNILLKCIRLYRLLGDEEGLDIFLFEASGYPTKPDGIPQKPWLCGGMVGRHYFEKDNDGNVKEYMTCTTLAELSASIEANKERLKIAVDPSSYGDNMTPYMIDKAKNASERNSIVNNIKSLTNSYNKIHGQLYAYILKTYQKLKYGNTIDDIFTASSVATHL